MALLKKLSAALAGRAPSELQPAIRQRTAQAVLLLEIARADFSIDDAERAAVRRLLVDEIGVPEAEVDALLASAGKDAREAVSLHRYIDALNATLDADGKRALIRMIWQVAAADGRIEAHEEHLARRLADLLYVSHADFIKEKLAVTENMHRSD